MNSSAGVALFSAETISSCSVLSCDTRSFSLFCLVHFRSNDLLVLHPSLKEFILSYITRTFRHKLEIWPKNKPSSNYSELFNTQHQPCAPQKARTQVVLLGFSFGIISNNNFSSLDLPRAMIMQSFAFSELLLMFTVRGWNSR